MIKEKSSLTGNSLITQSLNVTMSSHSMANGQKGHGAVQLGNMFLYVYPVYWLLTQCSVFIGQIILFAGWDNANNMRNATFTDTDKL